MSLYPYAGAHAVQSAAFALEWPVELTEAELLAIAGAHEKLKASLPTSTPLQTVTFQVVSGQPGSTSTSGPAGHTFSRQGPAGTARALEVQRNRAVGQVNDYTRWAPVWKEVKNWFSTIGSIIGDRQITHVGLQYNDVFHWRGDPDSLDLKKVFSENSTLLPRNVFTLKGLWHSHHGYFVDRLKPVNHQLLENINVNLQDELGQRSIVITTVHKALVADIRGWDQMSTKIDELMEDLHSRNKDILKNLLSDEAAKSITLFKESI
jgi:uncharacterized protein (TIGR04255 family)